MSLIPDSLIFANLLLWKKGEEALDSENSSWDSIQLQLKNATLKKNVIYFIVMFYG